MSSDTDWVAVTISPRWNNACTNDGRVGVDLLGEVGKRGTAGQPDGLAAAARQPDTADRRRLHVVEFLALLPLGLAALARRATGPTERTGCTAATTGTAAGTRRTAAEAATSGTAATAGTAGSHRRRRHRRGNRRRRHRGDHRAPPPGTTVDRPDRRGRRRACTGAGTHPDGPAPCPGLGGRAACCRDSAAVRR